MTDRVAFAAQRMGDQDKAIAYLLPYVVRALDNWSEDGEWWRPIMSRVRQLFLRTLREETQDPTSRDLAVWNEIAKAIRATIAKTGEPDVGTARALATWLSTYTINAATEAGVKALGLAFEMEWVTMHDEHVRPSHRDADGQRRKIGDKFTVDGVEVSRPGEPVGPISLWINCRCIVLPQVPATQAVAGADYVPFASEETAMTATAEEQRTESALGVPWHGVLAPEGKWSGDGRSFRDGSLSFRDLPLPLTWQKTSASGHDGSVVVAKIERLARVDGEMRGAGHYLSVPEADEAVGLVAEFGRFGVSVDADDAEFELEENTGRTEFTRARISSASMVPIPAFAEAWVSLGPPPEGFMPDDCDPASPDYEACMMSKGAEPGGDTQVGMSAFKDYTADERKSAHTVPGTDSYPIEDCADLRNAIQAIGRASDPAAVKKHIRAQKNRLGCPDVSLPEDWSAEVDSFADIEQFLDVAPGRTEDGPGWLTHPVDTDRLRDYWVHGPGAAKIGWGTPGDFNRCRALVAEYVKPQHLSGYCANRHYDATGFWPGRAPSEQTASDDIAEFVRTNAELGIDTPVLDTNPAPALTLVAGGGWCAPSEWFRDPKLKELTPLTVTEDGRVFGHLAGWTTCHVGEQYKGMCVTPPHSNSDYAYFMAGQVLTDDGPVNVGSLTMDTGHAGPGRWRPALAHYDNTGVVIADVSVGEDEFGIWLAGCCRPDADPEKVAALRAAKLSGDWRDVRSDGNLELIAALATNTSGFPVPRPRVSVHAGVQESLVAAGMVDESDQTASSVTLDLSPEAIAEFARAVEAEMSARAERRETLAALASRFGGE